MQRHPFTVRGDGHEVAETFWLTLDGLLAPHSAAIAGRGTDAERLVHYYEIDGRTVWGVTGGIVHDLLALLPGERPAG